MVPKRIAFFGSSSIYGTADYEVGGFVNRFRLWYESISLQHRVYNLGIWGEQTSSLADRIASEASRRSPHLILIYPGFNDCRREGSPSSPNAISIEDYREAMRELISNAQAVAETVVVTGYPFDEARTTPYVGTDSYYLFRDAEEYTSVLVAIANERKAGVLDFFSRLRDQDLNTLLAPDGLHGNAQGHELLFTITREFFRDAFNLGT